MKEMKEMEIEGLCDLSELNVVEVKYKSEEKEVKEELMDNWKEDVFRYMVVDRRGYEVINWLERYWGMSALNVYEGILENEREILKREGINVNVVICKYEGAEYSYDGLMRKGKKWLFEVVRWIGVKVEKDGYMLNWRCFSREEMIKMIWYKMRRES